MEVEKKEQEQLQRLEQHSRALECGSNYEKLPAAQLASSAQRFIMKTFNLSPACPIPIPIHSIIIIIICRHLYQRGAALIINFKCQPRREQFRGAFFSFSIIYGSAMILRGSTTNHLSGTIQHKQHEKT